MLYKYVKILNRILIYNCIINSLINYQQRYYLSVLNSKLHSCLSDSSHANIIYSHP